MQGNAVAVREGLGCGMTHSSKKWKQEWFKSMSRTQTEVRKATNPKVV